MGLRAMGGGGVTAALPPVSLPDSPAERQNPEYCLNAMASIFAASLPGVLDQIDARHGDDITLRDIVRYYFAPLETEKYDELPAMVLIVRESDYPDRERPSRVRFHDFELRIYEQSIERGATGSNAGNWPQEMLARRLYRTAEAVVTVLEANETLEVSGTAYASHLLVDRPVYSEFIPRRSDIMRVASITGRCYYST